MQSAVDFKLKTQLEHPVPMSEQKSHLNTKGNTHFIKEVWKFFGWL